jgi:N-acetylglucosaminyl-diphospho-decaprenol L-rhamnosyltransferase
VTAPVDVTVGVVAWNAADDLRRCLAALPPALEGLEAQVVVVDNGSADATGAVLAEHPWVEALRNARNLGLTPGRNQVIERVRGRHVLMLDADTRPRPGSVRPMTEYLDAHPRVGLVGAKLLDPDGSLQLSCRTFPSALVPFLRRPPLGGVFEHRRLINRHLMRDYDHLEPRPVDWVIGACQCYRASLLPVLGRYDERIFSHGGEDTDWCVRVWKAGAEVHYVPAAEVVHAYGHFPRRNPFSRQSRRGIVDYFYMQWKHRDMRGGIVGAREASA